MEEHNTMSEEKRDLFLPVSILIAAVLIAGAVLFASFSKGGSGSTGNAGAGGAAAGQQAMATTTPADVMTLGSRDAVLGNANAPVTIIEYGDYQCPYCGQFFSQTQPLIVQNYVNTGKAKLVFRDFPFLGSESDAAGNAAECAEDQGKLWPYHDALYAAKYADATHGGSEDDGFFSNAELIKLGQQVSGLDMTKFSSCVTNDSDANIVTQDKTNAANDGVNSTPTFFINGQEIQGAEPYTQFAEVINTLLTAK
jgi:protein-disulfide isomerase